MLTCFFYADTCIQSDVRGFFRKRNLFTVMANSSLIIVPGLHYGLWSRIRWVRNYSILGMNILASCRQIKIVLFSVIIDIRREEHT